MKNSLESNLKCYVSVGGLGFFPYAPGSLASFIVALIVFFLAIPSWGIYGGILVTIFFLGSAASGYLVKRGVGADPSWIVIDEVCGMMLALFLVPKKPLNYCIAFLAFRYFDIVKPFPVKSMENLPGGWGIMMDDLLAGALSFIIVHVLAFVC